MVSPDNEQPALTNDEAEAMLKRLAKHYKQPVMPVDRYCASLRTWAAVVKEAHEPGRFPHKPQGSEYHAVLDRVLLDISKSNLLWRLIYCGEKLRTKPCPEHKGRWSGIQECAYGCNDTGWIPEPEDRPTKEQYIKAIEEVEDRHARNTAKWGDKYAGDIATEQLARLRAAVAYLHPEESDKGIHAPFTPEHTMFVVFAISGQASKRRISIDVRLDVDPRLRTGADDGRVIKVPTQAIVDGVVFVEALFDAILASETFPLNMADEPSVLRYASQAGRNGIRFGHGSHFWVSDQEAFEIGLRVKDAVERTTERLRVHNTQVKYIEHTER